MKRNLNLTYIFISAVVIPLLIITLVSNKNETTALYNDLKQKDSEIKSLKNQLDNFESVLDTIPKKEKNKTKSDKLNINNQKRKVVEQDKKKGNCRTINYRDQNFDTYIVDLSKSNLSFNSKTKSGKIIKTLTNFKKYLSSQKKELIFATNGGMFRPNFNPVGLYIENSKELFPVNLKKGSGNFFLKPNGIFYINKWKGAGIIESSNYYKIKGKVKYATQSGPLLLINGVVHKKLSENSPNKYIRSGVGIINKKTVVFIISKKPVNFYDLAMLFKE